MFILNIVSQTFPFFSYFYEIINAMSLSVSVVISCSIPYIWERW